MWWSWVLATIGMGGLYLTTQKKAAGFVVGLGVQVLWVIFAVTTRQYGFIFSAVGFGAVNTLGLIRWRKRDATDRFDESAINSSGADAGNKAP